MARDTLTVWIFIYTTINLAECPVSLYFIFKDFDFSCIPQTWQNVLSETFLILGVLYYFYLASWLLIVCFPVTQEKWEDNHYKLLAPVGVCCWVSIFQQQWIVFAVMLGFVFFIGCIHGTILYWILDAGIGGESVNHRERDPLIVPFEVAGSVTV